MLSLGGAGAGLVWGWSVGAVGLSEPVTVARAHVRRRVGVAIAVAAASAAVGAEVALVAGSRAALAWTAAVAVGLMVHRAWRRSLVRRFGYSAGNGKVR